MQFSTQQQLGIVAENIACSHEKLQAFSVALAQMQDQLHSMISELAWDRARITGLCAGEAPSPSAISDAASSAHVHTDDHASIDAPRTAIETVADQDASPAIVASIDAAFAHELVSREMIAFEPIAAEAATAGEPQITAKDAEIDAGAIAITDEATAGKANGIENVDSEQPAIEIAAIAFIEATAETPCDQTPSETIATVDDAIAVDTTATPHVETDVTALVAPVAGDIAVQHAEIENIQVENGKIEHAEIEHTGTEDEQATVDHLAKALECDALPVVADTIAPSDVVILFPTATSDPTATAAPSAASAKSIVDIAARRRQRARSLSRLAAIASVLTLSAGSVMFSETLRRELDLQLSGLNACALASTMSNQATEPYCNALAWLSL